METATRKMTFEEALVSGGDERLDLDENGLNKYFVNPTQGSGVFNRGSCTCSFITEDAKIPTHSLYEKLNQNPDYSELYESLSLRIKSALEEGTEPFEVYLAPSGSDLCYFPLLFSATIQPEKPILNVVTCPEELGSGSVLAYKGNFFSQKTQIEKVELSEPLNKSIPIEFISFPARDEHGVILDHNEQIIECITEHQESHNVIVNLVIGSKSGIEDNLSIVEECQHLNVKWVVDICQLRVSRALIQRLLALNCSLLVTGSKFYQSPPFCGALIVPGSLQKQIDASTADPEVTKGFDRVFTCFDFPKNSIYRPYFQEKGNHGLLLRWEAALYEFEAISAYTESEVIRIVSKWNITIQDHMISRPDVFELMSDQDKTNKSIISFRIKKEGIYLSHEELKSLYKRLCLEGSKWMPQYDTVTIGQPVAYTSGSFLRVALGSFNVRQLMSKDVNLDEDIQILETLEAILHESA
ncbi:MAG: hypothetical protein HN542_00490 [Flavobacteriales bacterium]|jgi:hypothetical protein|nr:hypothetical protein [Flavobacteriales bacterium]MBT3963437.1 hypothetical protein [Flavobacteriales bacterium]MBT4704452.1 hypothetical protein [Flavobacteriales bacterium]MBT4931207.1 hypothetical protein [Flavobacteriales bacterium]MBT5132016.1 hypothetical protein [Flavobacteriales bacterium]